MDGRLLSQNKIIQLCEAPAIQGLELLSALQVRLIEYPAWLAYWNKFLRFDLPSAKFYRWKEQLLKKHLGEGFLLETRTPVKIEVDTLSPLAQDQLCSLILSHSSPQTISGLNPPEALLFSTLFMLQHCFQFDVHTLVQLDMIQLEKSNKGRLHGFFFQQPYTEENLSALLQSQQVETPYFQTLLAQQVDPLLAYCLARFLQAGYRWECLHVTLTQEEAHRFRHLAGFQHWYQHIRATLQAGLITHQSPVKALNALLLERPKQPGSIVALPVSLLVLVEGLTEELLLPAMAQAVAQSFESLGVSILGVGGKNQMMSKYLEWQEVLNIPVCILLDQDAAPLVPDLQYYLREQDKIILLEAGEIEDLYDPALIYETLLAHYDLTSFTRESLSHELTSLGPQQTVTALKSLWLKLGLGTFDKVEFAQCLAQTLDAHGKPSEKMKQLIGLLLEVLHHGQAPPLL
jgi:hypothetical protein